MLARVTLSRASLVIGLSAALLAMSGCPENDDAAPTASVTVSDQDADPATRVVVDQVVSPAAGWIVIHEDLAGSPGAVLGQTLVERGATLDVTVDLSRVAIDGETLHAMLHEDGGEIGSYEFPGPDIPVEDSAGGIVMAPFVVSVPGQVLPSVSVSDQLADPATEVTVDEVVSDGDGFIAIHEASGGTYGDVIGLQVVVDGSQSDLTITLDRAALDGETLYAVLHINADGEGAYEYAADVVVEDVWGEPIAIPFTVAIKAEIEPIPGVTVADQIADPANQVVIAEVVSNGPGVLVVHEDGGGTFGDVIGHAPIGHGTSSNVIVTLDRDTVPGEVLYAMLHSDAGTVGTYEPASDGPVSDADGVVIAPTFTILEAPAADPTCADYCAQVTTICTGDDDGYGSEDACLAYCEGWAQLPLGAADDVDGNTVGCRMYHAGVADLQGNAEDKAAHCTHAGATGANTCGSWCDNYCHLAMTNCTGEQAIYDDSVACAAACAGFAADGAIGAAAGDTVQCRIYHLGVAGAPDMGGAETHCPHGGVDGGGVCVNPPTPSVTVADQIADPADQVVVAEVVSDGPGFIVIHEADGDTWGGVLGLTAVAHDTSADVAVALDRDAVPGETLYAMLHTDGGEIGTYEPESDGPVSDAEGVISPAFMVLAPPPSCDAYCAAVTASCVDALAQYADEQACLDYCETWGQLPIGEASDTGGNTVGCRTYHAKVAAAADADLHCPHAGPTGDETCGSWCDNYCHLAMTNCQGEDAIYDDTTACMDACALLPADGDIGATAGDSVQCRIYHLGVAGAPDMGGPGTHCPHGGADGADVCVDAPLWTPSVTVIDQIADPADMVDVAEAVSNGPGFVVIREDNGGGFGAPIGSVVVGDGTNTALTVTLSRDTVPGEVLYAMLFLDGGAMGTFDLAEDEPVLDGAGSVIAPAFTVLSNDPSCQAYCAQITLSCVDDDAQYADEQACLDYCETWAQMPVGTLADTDVNTIGCRLYHAGLAGESNPAAHCQHAGPSGGDVCGAWCDTYCQLAMTNCQGDDLLYTTTEDCDAACALLASDGAPGDMGGDSVQCRIYHLGAAGAPDMGGPGTHCSHGGPDGDGVCVYVPTLYEDLGEAAGIETVIVDFVDRVLGDSKINGYFLNSSVDGGKLVTCLVKQVAAATGSPDHVYPGPGEPADADGCRNMVDAHAGMGVSTADFDDLVSHLVDALTDAAVGADDIATIASVLTPMAGDIVEDVDSDDTVYQRVGRKPAIETVVGGLLTDVLGDVSLAGFFTSTDAARLDLCLVRQVCGIDGPCVYGAGVEDALKIAEAVVPCRSMAATHAGLTDSDDASPITLEDFNALVGHLVGQLDAAGVAEGDRDAIVAALGALCDDIVDGGCAVAGPPTYDADVQPIFASKCGSCHTSGSNGGHSIGADYADALLDSYLCAGKTKGECTIVQIQSGYMPLGKGCTGDPAQDGGNATCLTQDEQDTLQAWIDAGMPEN